MRPHAKQLLWAAAISAALMIILFLVPPVWKLKSGPIEIVRWPKTGEQIVSIGPQEANWVNINNVSRHVINAIVVAEDSRFYTHHGVDLAEIEKSIQKNLREKRFVRGASTITQQVVKMSFLSPQKSILRKTREAIGALLLEMILDKDQILNWYINMLEFGDGVFGISNAAQHYFDTKAELLTIQHGANLALVLPSPNGWSKGLRERKLTEFGHKRYTEIITRMKNRGFITNTLWLNALATGDFGRPVNQWYAVTMKTKPKKTFSSKPKIEAKPADRKTLEE